MDIPSVFDASGRGEIGIGYIRTQVGNHATGKVSIGQAECEFGLEGPSGYRFDTTIETVAVSIREAASLKSRAAVLNFVS